ncbi:hypothetical protein J2Z48_002921, partial [Croceifilum oryzae]|nr:hypothetical protein [Croceifilum oryzae]
MEKNNEMIRFQEEFRKSYKKLGTISVAAVSLIALAGCSGSKDAAGVPNPNKDQEKTTVAQTTPTDTNTETGTTPVTTDDNSKLNEDDFRQIEDRVDHSKSDSSSKVAIALGKMETDGNHSNPSKDIEVAQVPSKANTGSQDDILAFIGGSGREGANTGNVEAGFFDPQQPVPVEPKPVTPVAAPIKPEPKPVPVEHKPPVTPEPPVKQDPKPAVVVTKPDREPIVVMKPDPELPFIPITKPADKPEGDKPKADKPKADKPEGDKPKADKPEGDKPKADKPEGDKPKADKPEGDKPKADKPEGDKPKADKPEGDKPKADKPEGDKPKADKPEGDKPKADKPEGDKPKADKPEGDKPKA